MPSSSLSATAPVARLRVRAGVRHALDRAALEQAIQPVGSGTPFGSAALDLVILPINIRCHSCDATTDTLERLPACPACGAVDVDANGGDELILESITYATAAPAAPAPASAPAPAPASAPSVDLAVGR